MIESIPEPVSNSVTGAKIAEDKPRKHHKRTGVLSSMLAIFFGLFFAYGVWEGIGNLIGVTELGRSLNTGLTSQGWIVLLLGILAPVIVFVLAYVSARRKNILTQVLIYLTGLALTAVVSLNLIGLFGAASLLI